MSIMYLPVLQREWTSGECSILEVLNKLHPVQVAQLKRQFQTHDWLLVVFTSFLIPESLMFSKTGERVKIGSVDVFPFPSFREPSKCDLLCSFPCLSPFPFPFHFPFPFLFSHYCTFLYHVGVLLLFLYGVKRTLKEQENVSGWCRYATFAPCMFCICCFLPSLQGRIGVSIQRLFPQIWNNVNVMQIHSRYDFFFNRPAYHLRLPYLKAKSAKILGAEVVVALFEERLASLPKPGRHLAATSKRQDQSSHSIWRFNGSSHLPRSKKIKKQI